MATDMLDGYLGLEAKHVWYDGFVLNDLSVWMPSSAYAKLQRITGWHSLPEADDNRDPLTGRIGEIVYRSFPRGKSVSYEGDIIAINAQQLRRFGNQMRSAFSDRSNEHTMQVVPDADYGSTIWEYNARTVSFDMDDEVTIDHLAVPTEYQQHFILTLRLSDPRYYLVGGASSVGPQAGGVHEIIDNAGTAPVDPTFTITVPSAAGGITIGNITQINPRTGANYRLFFNSGVPAGTLTVDFKARTASMGDGTDVLPLLNPTQSDWWDEDAVGLLPGNNELTVTGVTDWTVAWNIASW